MDIMNQTSRIYKDFDWMLYTIGMIYRFVTGVYRAPNDELAKITRDTLLKSLEIHDMRLYDKGVVLKLSYLPDHGCYVVTITGDRSMVIDDFLKLLECEMREYMINNVEHTDAIVTACLYEER
jgi:hypothetical protein